MKNRILSLFVAFLAFGCVLSPKAETPPPAAATDAERDPAGEMSRRSQPGIYKCIASAKRMALPPKGKVDKDIRFRDEDYFLEIDPNGTVQFSRSVSSYNAAGAGRYNFEAVARGTMGPGPHYVFFKNESPEYTYQLQPVYSYTEQRPMSSYGTGTADTTRTNVVFARAGNNKAAAYQELFPCFRLNQTDARTATW